MLVHRLIARAGRLQEVPNIVDLENVGNLKNWSLRRASLNWRLIVRTYKVYSSVIKKLFVKVLWEFSSRGVVFYVLNVARCLSRELFNARLLTKRRRGGGGQQNSGGWWRWW